MPVTCRCLHRNRCFTDFLTEKPGAQAAQAPMTWRDLVKSRPGIVWQTERIHNIPAKCEPGDTRDGRRLDHLVTEKQTVPRFRRKGAGKPLGTSLLGLDERAQDPFVVCKTFLVAARVFASSPART